MEKALVITQDKDLASVLLKCLVKLGIESLRLDLADCPEAVDALVHEPIAVVCLDLSGSVRAAIDCFKRLLELDLRPEIIVFTDQSSPHPDLLSIIPKTWDCIHKSAQAYRISSSLQKVMEYRKGRNKRSAVNAVTLWRQGIVGASRAIQDCLDIVASCAATDSSVLINGETGTGKELFARAIHNNSGRKSGKFVVVDCASLPETLVESVLFGHERGVYTGADRSRDGLIKAADGGTLFLDEVGELPLSLQKSFLRVLQEKRFRAIGSKNEEESDFRLVAATNRNLNAMCDEGLFRSDLLFRLHSFTILLPPLRIRPEDIEDIALEHLKRLCKKYSMTVKRLSSEFLTALAQYDWPGNCRELVSCIEFVLSHARDEPVLYPKHLPSHIRISIAKKSLGGPREALDDHQGDDRPPQAAELVTSPTPVEDISNFKTSRNRCIDRFEHEYLTRLLTASGGNLAKACSISDLSRSRIYGLLHKHKLSIK